MGKTGILSNDACLAATDVPPLAQKMAQKPRVEAFREGIAAVAPAKARGDIGLSHRSDGIRPGMRTVSARPGSVKQRTAIAGWQPGDPGKMPVFTRSFHHAAENDIE